MHQDRFHSFALLIWLLISVYVFFQGKAMEKINYFLLLQLFSGFCLLFLPLLLEKVFSIQFPAYLQNLFTLFVILAVFLGTGLNWVNKIPYWDKGLHLLSGLLFTWLGYSILLLIPSNRTGTSIWQILLFGFCFSLAAGVLWEFWEFSCDTFFGMNLQQFNGPKGIPKIGQAALMDTMVDLLADAAGALLTLAFTFWMSTQQHDYLHHFIIQRK